MPLHFNEESFVSFLVQPPLHFPPSLTTSPASPPPASAPLDTNNPFFSHRKQGNFSKCKSSRDFFSHLKQKPDSLRDCIDIHIQSYLCPPIHLGTTLVENHTYLQAHPCFRASERSVPSAWHTLSLGKEFPFAKLFCVSDSEIALFFAQNMLPLILGRNNFLIFEDSIQRSFPWLPCVSVWGGILPHWFRLHFGHSLCYLILFYSLCFAYALSYLIDLF